MNIARERKICKIIYRLIISMEVMLLDPINEANPDTEQCIQSHDADSDENTQYTTIEDSDIEEQTELNTEFPKLPDSAVSEITGMLLFNGAQYCDVFKTINETQNIHEFAADILKLNEILLRLDDQQFFDFCMQQSYFPSSVLNLKSFFEKLGIYDGFVFSMCRNYLFEIEKSRRNAAQSSLHLIMLMDLAFQSDPQSPSILFAKIVLKNTNYFQRVVFEFDDSDITRNPSAQWINCVAFLTSYEVNKRVVMMVRFFRFIAILQQFSIRCGAPNKEHIIDNTGILLAILTNDVLGALKRRAGFMKNIKYLKMAELSGDIELKFSNPEKLVWVEISNENIVDLGGHNINWILDHKNIEVLQIQSKKLLFDTEDFKKLSQLKSLRKMTILLDEKTIALAQASNTGFPTAENSGWSKSIDLCEMAALQNFELYSSVLESLAFRKMSMLHKLLLKDCLLTSAILQDVSSLLDVFLESCHLKSLSLQTVHALKNLNLIMSSFESIDLQEVQSIENLGFFKCDLLNMHSICMGLKTTKSLECLVIDECTGFMKLPYEISEISGLEVLHLDLKQLDSVDVGKYTSESEEPDCVQLKESFRLPSTLRDCSIYVNNDLVKSIMGIWFEKCDRSQLRLVINENDYVVTDDYQIVRRE